MSSPEMAGHGQLLTFTAHGAAGAGEEQSSWCSRLATRHCTRHKYRGIKYLCQKDAAVIHRAGHFGDQKSFHPTPSHFVSYFQIQISSVHINHVQPYYFMESYCCCHVAGVVEGVDGQLHASSSWSPATFSSALPCPVGGGGRWAKMSCTKGG